MSPEATISGTLVLESTARIKFILSIDLYTTTELTNKQFSYKLKK